MGQDVFVGAAGGRERVGQERQAVEGAGVGDGLGELRDGGVVPGEPGGVNGGGAERIAEYVTQHRCLGRRFPGKTLVRLNRTKNDKKMSVAVWSLESEK